MPTEPHTNIIDICAAHAPRPDPRLAQRPAASFLGCWVKRTFATPGGGREHMWVQITAVTSDGHLVGLLDNEPVNDVGYVCGDLVTVRLDEIEGVLEAPEETA